MSLTVLKLAEITDEGLFERLATAILRKQPDYASVLHTGVNAEGRTVAAPLDGICFVPGADPPRFIAAHHTTCKRDDLKAKWLHRPATAKSKRGGKTTKPPGDVVKTAEIATEERGRNIRLRVTLVLTTNQEPTVELVRDTIAAGVAAGIEIDIWSASRLADYLDNTASGQWIRYEYFGVPEERLSQELLTRLSLASLSIHALDSPELWISRNLDLDVAEAANKRALSFVVAESGTGKSVACYKCLNQHVASGGYGLILTDQVLDGAITIEGAIDAALHQLQPSLAPAADVDALSLCTIGRSFYSWRILTNQAELHF
jgi:hypothetical protein